LLRGDGEINSSNVNYNVPGTFSLDDQSVKITAFVSQDGNEISFVMFTPTLPAGTGGFDLGTVEIVMPKDFTIGSVQAHKSTGDLRAQLMQNETVNVKADRKSAQVTLRNSQLLSVKFTKE
jgi:hypothetical protein